jgi:hypothetical protein
MDTFKKSADECINHLHLFSQISGSIEKLIELVQNNGEFFEVGIGDSCVGVVVNKLQQLIEETKGKVLVPLDFSEIDELIIYHNKISNQARKINLHSTYSKHLFIARRLEVIKNRKWPK